MRVSEELWMLLLPCFGFWCEQSANFTGGLVLVHTQLDGAVYVAALYQCWYSVAWSPRSSNIMLLGQELATLNASGFDLLEKGAFKLGGRPEPFLSRPHLRSGVANISRLRLGQRVRLSLE